MTTQWWMKAIICFARALALTVGAACYRFHRLLLECVRLKIKSFRFVYKYFRSHWGAACYRVHRLLLRCVRLKIYAFPFVLQSFWLSLGVLPATAFIACCWSAFASKSMLFRWFHKHSDSHQECCLRLSSSHVAGACLLQNQSFWISPGTLPATAFVACCRGACFKNNVFPLFSQAFWPLLGVLPTTACVACCWGAIASKSMLVQWFYKHFDSHPECCLRLHSSHVAEVRASKSMCFSFFYKHFGSH